MTRLNRFRAFLLAGLLLPAGLSAHTGTGATRTPPPPAPAQAPIGVTAVPSSTRVVLSWAPVAGATGYHIYRSTTGVWEATPYKSTSRSPFTDTGLISGTVHRYRVSAYNKTGVGPTSAEVSALPLGPLTGLTATRSDTQITLTWDLSAGATSYTVARSLSSANETFVEIGSVAAPPLVDAGLVNGTRYYYRVRAQADGVATAWSSKVSAMPQPPPPATAPASLTALPGKARVTLSWEPVAGATKYRIFRTTTGVFDAAPMTTTATAFKNGGLVNGTAYTYAVQAANAGGSGPLSPPVTATPLAPPVAPVGLTATPADGHVTLNWAVTEGAATYNVYRGVDVAARSRTPLVTGLTSPTYVDPVAIGPTYFYVVTAINAGGESPRSAEVNAAPESPAAPVDPETVAAFRLLRQATWGPRPGDVAALKVSGVDTFLTAQLGAAPSAFPDALFNQPVEAMQEHFMQLALTGPDQLRQRVAWALHKIWVVSAVQIDRADAMVTYYRLLQNGAFGSYRDLMKAVTLNPAMGRYLNMLNNRSQASSGVAPNENYAREIMQLFTLGLSTLNPDGTPQTSAGVPLPAFSEEDVKELARILTGWTFGDGNPATLPRRLAAENYRVPMEPVERYHDIGPKRLLGVAFPAGQTAVQDLEQALDVLFDHANLAPFVSRQLIQQLVTSNPSPAYVRDVAAVFDGSGGDLATVVRTILTHPEAARSNEMTGKLSEPVLFVVSQLRGLNATVTNHPFMADKAEEMGQKVFYPPSVFSYFSPGYRVRGTVGPTGAPLGGPEFQILTAVTALVRVNFIGSLLAGHFGEAVVVDYAPFVALAGNPGALVDAVSDLFMGGRMSPEQRAETVAAVRVSPASKGVERVKTALYLTLVAAQAQVDR